MRRAAWGLALVLAGCGDAAAGDDAAGRALENAAIASGAIRDPAGREIAGLYARDTDRLCVVRDPGRDAYRVGVTIDYGGRESCTARGIATRDGGTIQLRFAAAPGCAFAAQIDGDRVTFPGTVPDACQRLCTEQASLAALEVDLLSDAPSEVSALRDVSGRILCGR